MEYEKELQELHCMQQIYSDMFIVINKIQNYGDKCMQGLTSRQYMAILAILHLPRAETTFINIARKLGTTKQNVSTMLNGLEKKGFVKTVPDERDKRSVNVIITELGMKMMAACSASGILLLEEIFHNFTLGELEVMQGFLKKFRHILGEDPDGFEEQVDSQPENKIFSNEELVLIREFSRRRNSQKSEDTE